MRLGRLFIHVVGILSVVWGGAILSQAADSADDFALIDFAGMESLWRQATNDQALDTRQWQFLQAESLTAPGPTRGDSPSYVLASYPLPPAERAHIIKRHALLEIFRNRASDYGRQSSRKGDATVFQERGQKIRQWQAQAQVELALLKLALAFDAREWSAKCGFLRQVRDYARLVSVEEAEASLQPSWHPLYATLKAMDQRFSLAEKPPGDGRVSPLAACDLPPPPSKEAHEERAQRVVDDYISEVFTKVMTDTKDSLRGPQQAYTDIENRALTSVPTKGILELRRTVENTLSNLQLVKGDMLMLMRVPDTQATAQKPLVTQVDEIDLAKLFDPGQTDEATLKQLEDPTSNFKAYLAEVFGELEKLQAIPDTNVQQHCRGLKAASADWQPERQDPGDTLESGLKSCLRLAVQAFATQQAKSLSAEERHKRALLSEVIKVSEFLTQPYMHEK
jgi:hypothetical protein